MPNAFSHPYILGVHFQFKVCWEVFFIFLFKIKRAFCKQKQKMETLVRRRIAAAASDLGLHSVPMSHKKDSTFIWVKVSG